MKLASLKSGRDGRLVIVSADLTRCTDASRIAPTLQAALDDWAHAEPHLRELAQSLEVGAAPVERFHERECASPLPRAYQWADGSAYVNHVALVRKARALMAAYDDMAELLATFNDVTVKLQASHEHLTAEVARLSEELRQANEAVARGQRLAALGEMAAGIAHEVRNPLGSIRLYARMLEQDLAQHRQDCLRRRCQRRRTRQHHRRRVQAAPRAPIRLARLFAPPRSCAPAA